MLDPYDRVWLALSHEVPDRVPLYEGVIELEELGGGKGAIAPGLLFISIDIIRVLTSPAGAPVKKLVLGMLENPRPVAAAIKPWMVSLAVDRATRLHRRIGVDMMGAAGGIPMVFNPALFDHVRVVGNTVIGPGGDVVTKVSRSGNQGAVHRNGFLRSPADWDKYMRFDPDSESNYFMTGHFLKAAKGRVAPVFTVFGAAFFENLCEIFGYEALFTLLVKDPGFISKAVQDMSDYACAVAEHLARRGVKLFYMTDDLGQKNRPMISPRMYRKYFKQGVSRFCKTVHKHGGKVMMHSDGGVMELVPDFIEAGIDALHPWESAAGMDIFEAKKRWGNKLALVGNVPIELLSHGTTAEVREYVTRLITDVAPGGGYILSSSHSIVSSCKVENYIEMIRTWRKLRAYK